MADRKQLQQRRPSPPIRTSSMSTASISHRKLRLRAAVDRRDRQAGAAASRARHVRDDAWRHRPRRSRCRSASIGQAEQAGWGIIFHADTPQDVRDALEPLIEHRRKQAGKLVKELDYNGEQMRDW